MFQGFTNKASEFLWELAFNNDREWFREHKAEFEEYVQEPMKALMRETVDGMNARFPDMSFSGHCSRIYRDARRLFGRGPFKDDLWFEVSSADIGKTGPKFWFEVTKSSYGFGMGYFDTPSVMLEAFRRSIAAEPARFERIARGIERHSEFRVYGQEYARPKGDFGESINRWYNRKSIGCGCERDFGGDVLRADLPAYLISEFEKLMPLFSYLCELYRYTENRSKEEQL